jgi:hypothetical protein
MTTVPDPDGWMLDRDRPPTGLDQPTHAELADGSWYAEPDQRPAYRALLRAGSSVSAALLAVRLPAYARHLNAGWEQPLSPAAFIAVINEAAAKHTQVEEVLARRGYRNEHRELPPQDPDAERKKAISDRKRLWALQDAEEGLDLDADEAASAPETARPVSESRSRLAAATQAAFRAARGIAGRSDNKARPSQTRAGRRRRYLRSLVDAGRYPDIETADKFTPHRGLR